MYLNSEFIIWIKESGLRVKFLNATCCILNLGKVLPPYIRVNTVFEGDGWVGFDSTILAHKGLNKLLTQSH
jgi:hypothetical protein